MSPWVEVPQSGRVAHGGRWHRLVLRPAMTPWPFDHEYPETLYPTCGSVAGYFRESFVVDMCRDHMKADCKKCLLIVTRSERARGRY